jgi:hypothetical protein
MFQRYVASVSDGCCKSRSGCCICCNGCTCMLLVSQIFICVFRRILQVCLYGCCICFTYILQVFYCVLLQLFFTFSGVFLNVLEVCFKCFIYLQTYIASVVSECFKSRSGVAHGMRVGRGHERSPRVVRRARALHGRAKRMRGCRSASTSAGMQCKECRLARGKHSVVRVFGRWDASTTEEQ